MLAAVNTILFSGRRNCVRTFLPCGELTRVLVCAPVITVNVKRAALKRGIKSPYELAQRFGDTTGRPPDGLLVLAGRLWENKTQPTLKMIDRLLDVLGDCELSELLVRTPNTRRRAPSKNGRNGSD